LPRGVAQAFTSKNQERKSTASDVRVRGMRPPHLAIIRIQESQHLKRRAIDYHYGGS